MSPLLGSTNLRIASRRTALRIASLRATAVVALLGSVACTSLTEANPTTNRYGAVSIRAVNGPNNTASANATAIFFEAFTAAIPNSVLQRNNQCVYAAVDTATQVVRGVKQAGSNITLGIGSSNVLLAYDATYQRYSNPQNSPFSYTSGQEVQVTIPGDPAVFPSATIGVRLAEPLAVGPVAVPAGTAPMTFTWNAVNDSTSAIILSLRYANPATSPYPNEQIYCSLEDDGTHQLPTSGLAAFLASPNNMRVLQITRWRTREAIVDARTVLHIATSVDTTITFQP